MNDQSYIEGIATIIANYRRVELSKPLDAEHIKRWVEQFEPQERSVVLKETFHALSRYYIKEERIHTFLDQVLAKIAKEQDINDVVFASIQKKGHSQTLIYEYIATKGNFIFQAAAVVKLIFDKANDNYSTRMIATHLNDLGIDTPSLHREKQNQYGGRRKVPDAESLWTIDMVRIILRRYEYTGALVHNRREKVQVGMSITRAVPESQRYITENAHDAIVSREEYDSAQAAIMFMNKSRFRIDVDYPLKGKIRCGVCNLAMAYHDLA